MATEKIEKIKIAKNITITGTTGTGDSVGVLRVPRSSYPGISCIIPYGLSHDLYNRIACAQITSEYFVFGVTNSVSGAWASGVTVTFIAVAM